ncbi:MAG TPA: ABC transporter permease [Pseudoclavibacter sp.]|nr:ABC transporter permease [Pseudoclavibacter sp.]
MTRPISAQDVEETVSWKAPITFWVVGVFSLIAFGVFGRHEQTAIAISTSSDAVQLPAWEVDSAVFCTVAGVLMIAFAIVATVSTRKLKRGLPLWGTIVYSALFLLALLTWIGAGGQVPVTWLFTGALALAVPILFGGISGLLCERVGVTNIAIEGQLLAGAFAAAVVASMTDSYTAGILAAMIAGALVSLVLAVFSITYLVDQVIVGVVLNSLVIGATNYLYSVYLNDNSAELNFPGTLPELPIPGLSAIPIIGSLFFDQRVTVYIMFLIVPLVYLVVFKTKWGLRLRAVGEYPLAADTVGINVPRTRFWVVTVAGLVAGIGGSAISIGSVGAFVREMSAGQGYIALAALILGRWNPYLVALAAVLFGFSSNLQVWIGQTSSGIPSDFVAMLPYAVTLIAVTGLVGRVRGPASVGIPYVKADQQ